MKLTLTILILLFTAVRGYAVGSVVPPDITADDGLTPYTGRIDQLIQSKSEDCTAILASTLLMLHSDDLYTHNQTFRCRQVHEDMFAYLSEKKVDAPQKYELFVQIKIELFERGGDVVIDTFKTLLKAGILKEREKEEIRNYIRKITGEDVPFSLTANDKSQKRDLLLLFTPRNSRTVIVKPGDVLERIAIQEYPGLSKHSSTQIIAFINNLKNRDSIQVGQKLKIYRYEIIGDRLAEWAK